MKRWLILFLILSAGAQLAFADQIDQQNGKSDEICSTYIGRMIRAANRFDAPTDARGKRVFELRGETTEDVLTELVDKPDIWARFDFEQKKAFVFAVISYADAQGGEVTTLLILLGRDAIPIAKELDGVPDSILRERYLLSDKGIQRYRDKISFLGGRGAIRVPTSISLIHQK